MTLKELLIFFENFYGEKYDGIFKDVIIDYLKDNSELFYSSCAKIIVKRFSRIYNKVPDPAIIEKHIEEILNSMPKTVMIDEPKDMVTDEEWVERKKWHKILVNFFKKEGSEGKPMAKIFEKTIDSFRETVLYV
jgi:hypothetical protein